MTETTTYEPMVLIHDTKADLGRQAGRHAGEILRTALALKRHADVMLAAAPSQEATLRALLLEDGIDWSKVRFFHMDEYIGLPADAPQGFGNWLQRSFFDHVSDAVFCRLSPAEDANEEAKRYESLMGDKPFDLVLLGLGVNGHLAFNDPPADFTTTEMAKVVALDPISRQQQVGEGHFASMSEVPERAITVTVPRLLNAKEIIASVPGTAKRRAVWQSLELPVSPLYPGTALRTHPRVHLYVDLESNPYGDPE